MTPIQDKRMLKKRMYTLKKRERALGRIQRRRRKRVLRLRLHQRLRFDLYNWKMKQKQNRMERKKKMVAKRETAKLNRTLKRRRKK